MNDPNGLIVVDGVWHLFFQHHPYSTLWGPMHWGHASSTDLVTWTEHPIALAPDALGTCFSGSAVETPGGEIKLLYTAHREAADGSDDQTQCLIHADRALRSFAGDVRNPVVGNPGLPAFRDPKVLWHAPTERWIMVLTHGQSIGIRSSVDLVHWELQSVFGEQEGQHGTGPWECPDLLELATPDGTTRWVLLVGIGSDSYGGGSGTQYFIGDFDGHRFVNANAPETVLWMDHGRDYYAAQSFFGATRPTAIAWASNWQYARRVPTRAFRGAMTLPRELGLVDTKRGLRLTQKIPASVAAAFESVAPGERPASGTYKLRIPVGADAVSVALFGEVDPHFTLSRSAAGLRVLTRRSELPDVAGYGHAYAIEQLTDAPHVDIFVDNGLVELGSADGLLWVTNLNFPADPAGAIRVERASADAA